MVQIDGSQKTGPKRRVEIDGLKLTGLNGRVKIDWSKKEGPKRRVEIDGLK